MSETGDGVDHLRIPFEKIKIGKKLEVQGYGTVFEGEFNGQRVALKQLNITNLGNVKPQLLAEILTISRFRVHPNLVALLGFCDEKSNEITLVYEYVASGNLADKMRKRLTTIQRFEICLGAARGLDYLHTGVDSGIVHGNIKLSKILLNSDATSSRFEAKVSSFGLSKIVPGKAQKSLDEVATKESDVYSFGVVLLQVLCGVSELVDTDDYQERHVTELVPKKMQQNKLQKVVHFDIRREIKEEALETYAKIACRCVMENPPKMAQVVEQLEKALILQGGEVTYVEIPNVTEVEKNNEGVNDLIATDDIVGIVSESSSSNGDKKAVEDTTTDNKTHTEDDSSNNDVATKKEKEIINLENESNNQNEEIQEKDPETTIDDNDSNKIIEEDDNIASSNGDTASISTNQESSIGDELERLRIPLEKIKIGKKIDAGGYGTMFEGEFNDQQVALKRLNITNLGSIKPKLLSAVLNVYRFRHHPNLVALIGFCDENNKEMMLVYEHVSGGNLADKISKHLTTIQRLEICLGAAHGIEYLHESKPGIIHGHLKLSKILLNSESEAKVSGFGFPRLLPGDVEIAPKSTGKESDAYAFGVLLLEVLCGVPELVDTDDYQERHVSELVPKRLEQNMLRKIVHFDIRDEITNESLETYAKIACRCVMENPPTMSEVVEQLEKALQLQISGNENGLPVGEEDHGLNTTEKESEETHLVEQRFGVPVSGNNDEKENLEEDNHNTTLLGVTGGDGQLLGSSNSSNGGACETNIAEEEPKVTITTTTTTTTDDDNALLGKKVPENLNVPPPEIEIKEEETLESEMNPSSAMIADGSLLLKSNEKPPELITINMNMRGSNSATQTQESMMTSTFSESTNGNGDDTTPSDYLLPKTPQNNNNVKKTSTYFGCCVCSCWQVIYDGVVLYGGLFWIKLVSWTTGQCSSKKD